MSTSNCIALGLIFMSCLIGSVSAAQFGLFTYQVTAPTTVAITDYPDSAIGSVVIPASIDGRSVTVIDAGAFNEVVGMTSLVIPSSVVAIESDAFAACSGLTSVSFASPSGVMSVGPFAFSGCSALTSISIPSGVTVIDESLFAGCESLTSVSLPAGLTTIRATAFSECQALVGLAFPASITSIEDSAFENCDGLVGVNLPVSLTSIGRFAFFDCDALATVSIPANVTQIGNNAFLGCGLLSSVTFAGNAPTMGDTVFDNQSLNPTLRIYFFENKSGFATPSWFPVVNQPPYATVALSAVNPLTTWLIFYNLPTNSDLRSDDNGDGVSLLMAYALGLNPNLNLASSMPKPVLNANQMSLTFFGGTPGLAYSVECSTTLATWSTAGVTLTAPDSNQMRTATVSTTGPKCFMRIKVTQ